ncbi:MAG: cyclase family protein [Oscillospiraceae bacterium]|jgi:arylformamidase|nr:cyclase family protein [Oscillospiraceae bacterium]
MRIYDITQEVFGCEVYPGDTSPAMEAKLRIRQGDVCNLSDFSMCAHNGTHVDAPFHFIDGGLTVDRVALDSFVGYACVAEHEGELAASDARRILREAKERDTRAAERILVKGRAVVTPEAARVFAEAGLRLFGNESQTVGPEDAPKEVHLIMLSAEIVLLEGIRLGDVPEGVYFLHAAPLKLGGCDGAPCRATLIGGLG